MKAVKFSLTIITAIFLAWMLLSWFDVINHNNPGQDGDPSSWNAFVILTEKME